MDSPSLRYNVLITGTVSSCVPVISTDVQPRLIRSRAHLLRLSIPVRSRASVLFGVITVIFPSRFPAVSEYISWFDIFSPEPVLNTGSSTTGTGAIASRVDSIIFRMEGSVTKPILQALNLISCIRHSSCCSKSMGCCGIDFLKCSVFWVVIHVITVAA